MRRRTALEKELDENREELKQMYNYNFDPPLTDKQLDLIKKLTKEAYLFKDDFPAGTFYRKKKLTKKQASSVIAVGVERKFNPYGGRSY